MTSTPRILTVAGQPLTEARYQEILSRSGRLAGRLERSPGEGGSGPCDRESVQGERGPAIDQRAAPQRRRAARTAGSIGGLVTASRYGGQAMTASARAAAATRFERQVDPDGVLSPEERARRAEAAKRAHFKRLGLRSGRARRARQ